MRTGEKVIWRGALAGLPPGLAILLAYFLIGDILLFVPWWNPSVIVDFAIIGFIVSYSVSTLHFGKPLNALFGFIIGILVSTFLSIFSASNLDLAWWIFYAFPAGTLVSCAVVGVELKWFKLKGEFATNAVNYASGFFVGFTITCLVIILSWLLYFFGGTEYFPGILADIVMPILLAAMLAGLICGAVFGLLYAAILRFLKIEPGA